MVTIILEIYLIVKVGIIHQVELLVLIIIFVYIPVCRALNNLGLFQHVEDSFGSQITSFLGASVASGRFDYS